MLASSESSHATAAATSILERVISDACDRSDRATLRAAAEESNALHAATRAAADAAGRAGASSVLQ